MKIKKILAATLALSLAVSAPFSNNATVSKVSAASKPAQVKNVTFKIKNNKGIVSYKKVTGVSGYQIVLANNKTFTKGKKVVKTKQTKKTLTISAKKTTFLKVRAYKQTKKETVYGAFSKIVSVNPTTVAPSKTPVGTPTLPPTDVYTPSPTDAPATEAPVETPTLPPTGMYTPLPTETPATASPSATPTGTPVTPTSTAIVASPTALVATATAIVTSPSVVSVKRTYDFWVSHPLSSAPEDVYVFTNRADLLKFFAEDNGSRLKNNEKAIDKYTDEFFKTNNYVVVEHAGDISGIDYAIESCVQDYTVSENGCLNITLVRTTITKYENTAVPAIASASNQFFTFVTDKSVTSATFKVNYESQTDRSYFEIHMCKKPVIYLYPTKEQNITVSFDHPDALTCVYPAYNGEWNVIAKPDGTLTDTNTGRNLYSLYYEAKNSVDFKQTEDGFVVKGCDAAVFLEEKLEILGLNYREAEEFIIYWLPILERNEYNYIRFATPEEINKNVPLNISGNPDTIIRVLMEYKAIDAPIDVKEQVLTPVTRSGYTVVEWGGTEI